MYLGLSDVQSSFLPRYTRLHASETWPSHLLSLFLVSEHWVQQRTSPPQLLHQPDWGYCHQCTPQTSSIQCPAASSLQHLQGGWNSPREERGSSASEASWPVRIRLHPLPPSTAVFSRNPPWPHPDCAARRPPKLSADSSTIHRHSCCSPCMAALSEPSQHIYGIWTRWQPYGSTWICKFSCLFSLLRASCWSSVQLDVTSTKATRKVQGFPHGYLRKEIFFPQVSSVKTFTDSVGYPNLCWLPNLCLQRTEDTSLGLACKAGAHSYWQVCCLQQAHHTKQFAPGLHALPGLPTLLSCSHSSTCCDVSCLQNQKSREERK